MMAINMGQAPKAEVLVKQNRPTEPTHWVSDCYNTDYQYIFIVW